MHLNTFENVNNQQVDVILATVPWTDSTIPLMAPAALKPIVEKAGLSCLAVDFNIEVYNMVSQHPNRDSIIKFFFDGVSEPNIDEWIQDLLESAARDILKWNPKFVGLSLFSYVTRNFSEWLCYYIKKIAPEVKIIVGGAGCLEQFTGPSLFADDLRDRGLIDFHIRGDGEHALLELLQGNSAYMGINAAGWRQLERDDLEQLPYPDYSNYDFGLYKKKILGIHGSRGCVRQCTFCDFIQNWTKFNWRSADNIFEEMKIQYNKYGIRHFKFHDTLTNGNLKEFNRLIQLLADHNRNNPQQSFKWSGYYIFREHTPRCEQMWETMAASGADVLAVGIENLNQDIRFAIGKKFSNEAIDFHLEQGLKHNIHFDLLFIVGYVTETQAHIDFAKQWLRDHVQHKNHIFLQWGGTLGIFPNTYLDKNKEKLGITMIGNAPNLWISKEQNNTPSQRAQWVRELTDLSDELGYTNFKNLENHFILEQLINTDSNEIHS